MSGGAINNAVNRARAKVEASVTGVRTGVSTGVSTGVISIDHSQVTIEVNRLRGVADELNRLHIEAQNALRDMSGAWEGSAANEFSMANERWRAELRAIENEILELAALIQRIADEVRDAERRAKAAITGV